MLELGKSLNRNYNIRLPFLDGFYNIGLFFNSKSTFLLFSVKPDFSESKSKEISDSLRINMFKNIESSKFSETFLNLHTYNSRTLDIINQFKEIKPEFTDEVGFIFNETITLNKVTVGDNIFYDQLLLYMLTINSYNNEFFYLIAERQNINQKLGKKIVRTSGLQISSGRAMSIINDFYNASRDSEEFIKNESYKINQEEVITLDVNSW